MFPYLLCAGMRHKSEMVVYEAARSAVSMPNVTGRDLGPAMTMLHMFLASPKPALRFAAVRTLLKLAAVHPMVVAKCNVSDRGGQCWTMP